MKQHRKFQKIIKKFLIFSFLCSFIDFQPSFIFNNHTNCPLMKIYLFSGFSAGLLDDNDIFKWEVLIIGPPGECQLHMSSPLILYFFAVSFQLVFFFSLLFTPTIFTSSLMLLFSLRFTNRYAL